MHADSTFKVVSSVLVSLPDGLVVDGRSGTFAFWHAASTTGANRSAELSGISGSGGTGELSGISGDGGLAIDPDGTHRFWLHYEIG